MARRMKIDSVVGSYLDPLADKVIFNYLLCVLFSALTLVSSFSFETSGFLVILLWISGSYWVCCIGNGAKGSSTS